MLTERFDAIEARLLACADWTEGRDAIRCALADNMDRLLDAACMRDPDLLSVEATVSSSFEQLVAMHLSESDWGEYRCHLCGTVQPDALSNTIEVNTMKYLYATLILAGALSVSIYYEPQTSDISNAKCERFMALASEASGLEPLETCPEVRIHKLQWFIDLSCDGVAEGCRHPVGVVRTADDRVIHILEHEKMNPKYSDPMRRDLWDSVLLHEMIHVLQYEKGLAPRTFFQCKFMENQAYHLQANYLMRKGIRMAIPGNMGCRS